MLTKAKTANEQKSHWSFLIVRLQLFLTVKSALSVLMSVSETHKLDTRNVVKACTVAGGVACQSKP